MYRKDEVEASGEVRDASKNDSTNTSSDSGPRILSLGSSIVLIDKYYSSSEM